MQSKRDAIRIFTRALRRYRNCFSKGFFNYPCKYDPNVTLRKTELELAFLKLSKLVNSESEMEDLFDKRGWDYYEALSNRWDSV